MNHPKTRDEELERLAREAIPLRTDNAVSATVDLMKRQVWIAGYRAAQSETELLRKRVEKLENALTNIATAEGIDMSFYGEVLGGKLMEMARQALADDKASEGGV